MNIRSLALVKGQKLWLNSIKEGGYYSPPMYRELYKFNEILTNEDVKELEMVCYTVFKFDLGLTLAEWRQRNGQILIAS